MACPAAGGGGYLCPGEEGLPVEENVGLRSWPALRETDTTFSYVVSFQLRKIYQHPDSILVFICIKSLGLSFQFSYICTNVLLLQPRRQRFICSSRTGISHPEKKNSSKASRCVFYQNVIIWMSFPFQRNNLQSKVMFCSPLVYWKKNWAKYFLLKRTPQSMFVYQTHRNSVVFHQCEKQRNKWDILCMNIIAKCNRVNCHY